MAEFTGTDVSLFVGSNQVTMVSGICGLPVQVQAILLDITSSRVTSPGDH